jgi:transcriptional regulator with XRE-family HTH domain
MTSRSRKRKPARNADLIALGARIREERSRHGMTQAALAQELGLSIAYLSLIERAGRNSPFTTVVAIAKALQVPVSRLVG